MAREPDEWMLCQADLSALEDLREEIWSWRRKADHGGDLIALGAAVQMMDAIIEREDEHGCSVQLTLEPERYTPDMMRLEESDFDGTFYAPDVSISDGSIELGIMRYVETGQGGFDHESIFGMALTRDGGFNTEKIEDWISKAQSARASDTNLRTTINFLKEYE